MSRAIPKWEPIEGDLATPLGFRAAAVAAGIKKTRDALDLALIFSDSPATTAAGVFTTNRVAAAPVLLSRKNLVESRGRCRAIVVNSGNANACTGREGMHTAEETARVAAELLGIEPSQVLVASTGVIGVPLNADLILPQLPHLKERLSKENAQAVAHAIMTTDTVPKTCVVRSEVKGQGCAHRRHCQRGGDDSSAHGHHAFFHHHGRLHGRAHVAQPADWRRRKIPSIASP